MAGIYDGLWTDEPGDGEDFGSEGFLPSRQELVVMVDCRNKMMEARQDSGGLSYFQMVLGAIAKYARKRIIASKDDQLALVLYGTVHQNPEVSRKESLTEFDHVFVQNPLEYITAQRIKDLEALEDQDPKRFQRSIGSQEGHESAGDDLMHALWTASQLLNKSTAKAVKRVWIFTEDDFSHMRDDYKRKILIGRGKDLSDTKIEIELFPLAAEASSTFRMEPLWKEFLQLSGREEAEAVVEEAGFRLGDLAQAIYRRASVKRTLISCKWTLSEGLSIAVQGFGLVGKQSKAATQVLEARTNEPLRKETLLTCADTGQALHSINKRYITLREQKVVLSDDVMTSWQRQFPRGIVLLGFKAASSLQDFHQIRPAYFIYPDEKSLPGSSSAFIALHQKMITRKQVAIVRFSRGSVGMPRLAALVAQREEQEELESGRLEQSQPPGMHLIFLPFADDIRNPEAASTTVIPAPQEAVDKAKAMISAMSLGEIFTSSILPNPALQHHYAVLHALALGEPAEPEQLGLQDPTDIKLWDPAMGEEAAAACLEAAQALSIEVYGPDGPPDTSGGKKTAVAGSKRKAEAGGADNKPDVEALAKQGKLGSLTVADLKAALSDKGLSPAGRKPDLIARLSRALGK